jgi:hypothetical protein
MIKKVTKSIYSREKEYPEVMKMGNEKALSSKKLAVKKRRQS